MTEERVVNGNGSTEDKELQFFLDPAYPLLHRFREVCPGSFRHSMIVSGVMEGIALALNLSVFKMKLAAYYHDIGKLFNPKFFIENQIGEEENPHDKLSPIVSYNIISRHVSDSVIILINEPKFPLDTIEIISHHHGTSILQFFYDKSEKLGKETENAFRYKTTKPKYVESMILMIVDRIEATSRSMGMSNKFNPVQIINQTISGLLEDSQLDNVFIKLGDLKRIKEILLTELEGVFSKRVDYQKNKEDTTSDGENEKEIKL